MIPLRNILRSKARSITTVVGIAVGIAVFVAISSVASHMRGEVQHVISGYETDITVQQKGASTPIASAIAPETFRKLRGTFGKDVSPLVIGTLREEWNPYALVVGITPGIASRFGWVEGSGAPLQEGEVALGSLLSQQLVLRTGSRITVAGRSFRIGGIYSIGSRFFDGGVMADLPVAQSLLGRDHSVNLALVRVRDKAMVPSVVREINRRFPELRALPSAQFVGTMRLFQTVEAFARAITAIAFLGAVIVVTNTLLMAVSERTREIGILMAVGWHPGRVLGMLLSEGLLLCLCGSLLGNGLGLLMLRLLSGSRVVGFGWLPTSISGEIMVASLEVAVALASLAVIWPAAVVFRLNPAEALRHE